MLRYKTKTRPGLVALYDIRPGNGAGPFLQPRSPHGELHLSRTVFERIKITYLRCNGTYNEHCFTNVVLRQIFTTFYKTGCYL